MEIRARSFGPGAVSPRDGVGARARAGGGAGVRAHAGAWAHAGVLALALTAAALVAAACGNTSTAGPVGSPEGIIASAPDVTLGQHTAKVVITGPHAQATGVISFATHNALLSVATPANPAKATVVIVGGTGYAQSSPGAAYQQMHGLLPLSTIVDPHANNDGSNEILPSSDPWADIDLLRGTVHILSNGGGEVDGASTIGYTLTVDPAKAVQATPAERQPALQALLKGRTKPFMINVAIDSAFRIRQIEVAANLVAPDFSGVSPPTRVDGETIGTDVDFVGFGQPTPVVSVPPNLANS